MAEIKSREQDPIAGIEYSEIIIPDENNMGTGTFTSVLKPDAMAKNNPLISTIVNEPVFKMFVNINIVTEEASVLLGKADDSPASSRGIFKLPKDINTKESHRFEAIFKDWKIKGLKMNGKELGVIKAE
ncbi:MAG: hypothetical protein AAB089_00170 [Nitrospirota bacterium]